MNREIVTVERVGPYGIMANNVWYGISKDAEIANTDFEKGRNYEIFTNTAQSGKKYIQKMTPADNSTPPQVDPAPIQAAPKAIAVPAKTWGTDPDTQDRIARNTAYQKATDAVSRLMVPFLAREEDIVSKLQAHIEPMAQWLYGKIKGGLA